MTVTSRHNGAMNTAFCPGCGLQLWSQWGFCPRCGRSLEDLQLALWQNPSGSAASAMIIRSPQAEEALGLLRSGLTADAEERLRASLAEAPADVELRLILAGLLLQRYAVHEAGALLDEAAALAPDEFLVRLRRGEYCARLGRYQDALSELERARRLPAPDLSTLLYCQELWRWVSERARQSCYQPDAEPYRPPAPTPARAPGALGAQPASGPASGGGGGGG